MPRLLSCGHSVCHDCLSKLTIRSQVLLCPFDREPTRIGDSGIWGLKKNFALLDLLERLQLNKDNEISQDDDEPKERVRCDENEKHIATLFCLVCSTHLCDECSKESHSTKTLSKHQRVPLCEKPKGISPLPIKFSMFTQSLTFLLAIHGTNIPCLFLVRYLLKVLSIACHEYLVLYLQVSVQLSLHSSWFFGYRLHVAFLLWLIITLLYLRQDRLKIEGYVVEHGMITEVFSS